MKKQILGALIATTLVQSATPAFADNEELGTIIGAIAGVAVGSQVGHGKDRTAAIIIGAIAGSLIGNQIGRNLEDGDRRALGDAQQDCFRRNVGERVDWDGRRYGSRSQARGSFTSTQEGYNARTGEYCRSYTSVIYAAGREEKQTGVACSRPDGSWYESRTEEVNFGSRGGRVDERVDGRWDGRQDDGLNGDDGWPGDRRHRGDRWRDRRDGRQDDGWQRPRPRPPEPVFNQGSSAQIFGITRQTGGQWYRISLQDPMSLNNVQVQIQRANVRFHDASIVTANGRRLPLFELSNTPVLGQYAVLNSYVNTNEPIVAIDIRAESFGGYADIEVSATSNEGNPSLYTN